MHSRTISQRFSLVTIAILVCAATQAVAQAGTLDPTFATGGIFVTNTNNRATANAVAIQSDGKIVVAGLSVAGNAFADALIRLNIDGTLDTTFGVGGFANLTPPGNGNAGAFGFFALTLQSDGKIVAAAAGAEEGSGFQVAQVESNGSLDGSFGTDGFSAVVSTGGFIFQGGAMALEPNGKIVVAAGSGNPSVMARFTRSGQLDTTFGTAGIVNLQNPSPMQMAVQSNGKILVASGEPGRLIRQPLPTAQAGTITRYNANGALDTTFGASGTAACVASASSLLLQSDGKIVVAGTLISKLNAPQTVSDIGFGIIRYNPNGSPDPSFGTGGVAITDFGVNAPNSGAFAVAIQSNGDIVAGGIAGSALTSGSLTTSSFGLARYTSAGKLDAAFGSGGIVITNVAPTEIAWVSALAIQSDGKILAGGTSNFNFEFSNAYVARYLAQ
jgi:uncharacterized delta-60 repeat protein